MAIEAAAGFLVSIDGLEHLGQSRRFGQAALRTDRAVAHSGDGALVLPMLGAAVIERAQRVAALAEASGLFVFQLSTFNDGVEAGHGLGPCLGHPDLLACALGFPLLALRKLVEDVGGLVHQAPPFRASGPDLAEHDPNKNRAFGNDQLRRDRETATLEAEQKLAPVLRAFPSSSAQPINSLRPNGAVQVTTRMHCLSSSSLACSSMPSEQL